MRLRHISRNLAAAWLTLLFERLWRRFLPLLLLVLAFAACCWLNLFALLPPILHMILLALFAAAFIAALVLLCLLRLPARQEAAAKLARDSGLQFGELELDETKLAAGAPPAAVALWQAHKQRMKQKMPALKWALPRPNIPLYDKYGLRAAVFLLFAVAFAYSLSGSGGRLSDAFYFGPPLNLRDVRINAWIDPPEWTGRPPVYLTAFDAGENAAAAQNISVPAGSLLTMRVNDKGRGLSPLRCLNADSAAVPAGLRQTAADSVYTMRLLRSMRCSLSAPNGAQAWNIRVEADRAPQIAWAGAPERALGGMLKLRYTIYDDYGVKKAWAEMTPLHDSAAAPFYFARLDGQKQLIQRRGGSLTVWQGRSIAQSAVQNNAETEPVSAPLIPLPQINLLLPRFGRTDENAERGQKGGEARTEINLSKSAWAGAYISLRLAAEDGAGHISYGAPRRLVLPQQNFVSPIARALSEQRRLLAESSANAPRVAALLGAVLLRPEKEIQDKSAALALFSLRARLAQVPQVQSFSALQEAWKEAVSAEPGDNAADRDMRLSPAQLAAAQNGQITARDAALRDIAAYMGVVAEGIDGGKLAAAERRLQQASRALREALRNGASEEEIARLMQNLRSAMDDYISMLAERGQNGQGSGDAQMLGDSDLEKKLKALEDAAKQGQRGTAEQMLSEFDALMKNLQITQGNGEGRLGGKSGKQSQMQKQMDALSDIMRRQQQLLDDTHKNREEALRGEEGLKPRAGGKDAKTESEKRQSGEGGQAGKQSGQEKGQSLSERQQQLQQDLQNLQQQMQGRGFAPKSGFGAAQQQMGESRQALQQGDASRAQGAQAEALQNLRDDAQAVMEQMRQALAREDAARQAETGGNSAGGKQARQSEPNGQDPLGRPSGTGQAGNYESLPEGEASDRARHILEEIRKRLGALTPKREKEYLERLLNFE